MFAIHRDWTRIMRFDLGDEERARHARLTPKNRIRGRIGDRKILKRIILPASNRETGSSRSKCSAFLFAYHIGGLKEPHEGGRVPMARVIAVGKQEKR